MARIERKFAIMGIGVLGIALVLCAMVVIRGISGGKAAVSGYQPPEGAAEYRGIPSEELFLPEEPDFIPRFIPDREKREIWTAGDADPFWIDPLTEGEEKYIDMTETAINNLMERVP